MEGSISPIIGIIHAVLSVLADFSSEKTDGISSRRTKVKMKEARIFLMGKVYRKGKEKTSFLFAVWFNNPSGLQDGVMVGIVDMRQKKTLKKLLVLISPKKCCKRQFQ
jgi:hypothetical protein